MTAASSRVSDRAMNSFTRALDAIDLWSCRRGLRPTADWSAVTSDEVKKLYAGRLSRQLVQFDTHLGLTPFSPSSRNIAHDLLKPFPIADGKIEMFQAEDVLEHIPYDALPAIFAEIHRILMPGGLFRLSVPDYRSDIYLARVLRGAGGEIVFDPGGGGRYEDGVVKDGGHLWFPVYESVKNLFDHSPFASGGQIGYLHYTDSNGDFVLKDIDYSKGNVLRTPDHDDRARSPRRPLSIVVDAYKRA
jgi:SAM-dependent methyltransferase